MPIVLSSRCVDSFITYYQSKNFENISNKIYLVQKILRKLLKNTFQLIILAFYCNSKGIRRSNGEYLSHNSLDPKRFDRQDNGLFVSIATEANERSPLLKDDHNWKSDPTSAMENYGGTHCTYVTGAAGRMSDYDDSEFAKYSAAYYNSTHMPKLKLCQLRLWAFVCVLSAGLIIAVYLLITEYRTPSITFSLELVHHDVWSKTPVLPRRTCNQTRMKNVVILETGGARCYNLENCTNALRNLQQKQQPKNTELLYNFFLSSDGQTYEARGWDHESGLVLNDLPQSSMFVIGFIGTYSNSPPTALQLQALYSLIRESVRRQKLDKDYVWFGLRNTTASYKSSEALFNSISMWSRPKIILHIS